MIRGKTLGVKNQVLAVCEKSLPAVPVESCPSDSEVTDSDHEADYPTFPLASTDKLQKEGYCFRVNLSRLN